MKLKVLGIILLININRLKVITIVSVVTFLI